MMEDRAPRRGWISVYAAAFGLVLAAGAALLVSSLGTLRSIGLLWISCVLSLGAIGLGIASVLLPRRR